MSWSLGYQVALWAVLAGGLLPGAWFAVSWGRRVRHPMTWQAFDAGGWVYALLILYFYSVAVYLIYGVPIPTEPAIAVARLALGLLLDAVLIGRALAWRRLRAAYRRPVVASPQPGDRY